MPSFLIDCPSYLSKQTSTKRKLPTVRAAPVDKRRRQSKQSEHEHADNLPDDWEPVPLHDLSLETSLYANFEPQKCIIPPSWYWIESNDEKKVLFI